MSVPTTDLPLDQIAQTLIDAAATSAGARSAGRKRQARECKIGLTGSQRVAA